MSLNVTDNLLLSDLVFLLLLEYVFELERVESEYAHVVGGCVQVLFQVSLALIEEVENFSFSELDHFNIIIVSGALTRARGLIAETTATTLVIIHLGLDSVYHIR